MMGYICEEHGFFTGMCDTSKAGERICPQCGEWVRGVTGRGRSITASPPEGESHASGEIEWWVGYGTRVKPFTVHAFDAADAGEKAVEKARGTEIDPQDITEIKPRVRRYRR